MVEKNVQMKSIENALLRSVGFAGSGVVFFLTLFNTKIDISKHPILLCSAICFALSLPLISGMVVVGTTILKNPLPEEKLKRFLGDSKVMLFRCCSEVMMCLAIILLVFHISVIVGCFMIVGIAGAFVCASWANCKLY